MIANPEKYFYWNSNTDWYEYDENDNPYLTEKAPDKAKESFENYLELQDKIKESSVKII